MMKILEMSEKLDKLERNLAGFGNEVVEMRRENAKLGEEIGQRNANFERQIVMLNDEVAKLKRGNRVLEWQIGESVDEMNFNKLEMEKSKEENQNELAGTMLMGNGDEPARSEMANHQQQQNFDNIFHTNKASNILIKQEWENAETNVDCQQFEGQTQPFGSNVQIEDQQNEFADEICAENPNFDENNVEKRAENEIKMGMDAKDAEKEKGTKRTHSEERPFMCAECGKSYKKSTKLREHQRKHTGERPFVCQECGQAFFLADTLKSHMRIHTGERPFKCKECGQSFSHSKSLKEHERIHTGERPYVCGECGQAFKHLKSLNEHERDHTGERPFQCGECDKAYKRSRDLNKHRQTQH